MMIEGEKKEERKRDGGEWLVERWERDSARMRRGEGRERDRDKSDGD